VAKQEGFPYRVATLVHHINSELAASFRPQLRRDTQEAANE